MDLYADGRLQYRGERLGALEENPYPVKTIFRCPWESPWMFPTFQRNCVTLFVQVAKSVDRDKKIESDDLNGQLAA